MTDPANAERSMVFDRLHPSVDALPSVGMPAGRIVGFAIGPDKRSWEVIVHEAESRYTLRTPAGFDGADECSDPTCSKGSMIFTDFDTVSALTVKYGSPIPRDVRKAIKDGKLVEGWEPGTYVTTMIKRGYQDGILTALPLGTMIKHLAYEFTGDETAAVKPTLLKRIGNALRRKPKT